MADAYRAEIQKPKLLEEATSMGAAVIAGDFGAVCDLLQNQVRHQFEALKSGMREYLELDQRRKALLRGAG